MSLARSRPGCHHLSLDEPGSQSSRDGCVFVVEAVDALGLCRRGDFERVPGVQAGWQLRRHRSTLAARLVRFASRCQVPGLGRRWQEPDDLAARVLAALEHGALVAVRPSLPTSAAGDDTLRAQRRLIRELESLTHGRISDGGRQYKLVPGADLAGMPERNRHEVVARAEAKLVLARMAEPPAPSEAAALLGKATELLSPDWRPPMSPSGLVLVHRLVEPRVASLPPGPALTPSQLSARREAEQPLEFFARFVDEHGEPVDGFSATFAYGSDPDLDLAFSGAGFVRSGDHTGPGRAALILSADTLADLDGALEKRWQKVRGPVDEQWREQEAALVEIDLPAEGPLELSLEAGKRHTFVLRPQVALAHLHGLYFDTDKCFLLPSALPSLRRLVELYRGHAGEEVLIVGHADTAGTEDDNLPLSGERADAMRAYLCDDADVWLDWYGSDVAEAKRWGAREDQAMIDALIPRHERPMRHAGRRVLAYQRWHNAKETDASDRPAGWEKLEPDGKVGEATRRQLILDYMNVDGTSLPKGTRVVTYGCGESHPLDHEEGAVDAQAADGAHVRYDRRVELFFFGQPFGILPAVPGVAKGESNARAVLAEQGARLYPEWRLRAARRYAVDGPAREIRLVNEIGLPLPGRRVRVAVPERAEVEVVSDQEGVILVSVPEGAEFDLILADAHEGGEGESLETPSGTHFAAGADGPVASS